jgi:hypothetical protein
MSVLTIIKKIGDKVISIVEWPIKHSVMLVEMFTTAKKDLPATEAALTGLVQQAEALGPDAIATFASKGFDISQDVKDVADVKAFFTYVQNTFLPAIEQDYADFKKAEGAAAAAPATALTGTDIRTVVPA